LLWLSEQAGQTSLELPAEKVCARVQFSEAVRASLYIAVFEHESIPRASYQICVSPGRFYEGGIRGSKSSSE